MRDLNVITVDNDSRIASVETTSTVSNVYGITKLMQEVIKMVMGDIDPLRMNTSIGGNINSLLGPASLSGENISSIAPLIVSYIMDSEKAIKDSQATGVLSDEEILDSITVVDVYRDTDSGAAKVDILVKNKIGEITTTSLGI